MYHFSVSLSHPQKGFIDLFSVQSSFAIPRSVLIQMNALLYNLDHVPFSSIGSSIHALFHGIDSAYFSLGTHLATMGREEVDTLIADSVACSSFFYHALVQDQWFSIPLKRDLFTQS